MINDESLNASMSSSLTLLNNQMSLTHSLVQSNISSLKISPFNRASVRQISEVGKQSLKGNKRDDGEKDFNKKDFNKKDSLGREEESMKEKINLTVEKKIAQKKPERAR